VTAINPAPVAQPAASNPDNHRREFKFVFML